MKELQFGYVPVELSATGIRVEVEIIGECYPAQIQGKPRYHPYGWRIRA